MDTCQQPGILTVPLQDTDAPPKVAWANSSCCFCCLFSVTQMSLRWWTGSAAASDSCANGQKILPWARSPSAACSQASSRTLGGRGGLEARFLVPEGSGWSPPAGLICTGKCSLWALMCLLGAAGGLALIKSEANPGGLSFSTPGLHSLARSSFSCDSVPVTCRTRVMLSWTLRWLLLQPLSRTPDLELAASLASDQNSHGGKGVWSSFVGCET